MMETSGDEGSAIPLDVPGMGTSFDYFVDTTVEGGKFVPWRNVVPSFKYDKSVAYTSIMVPTADTTKFGWLQQKLITGNKPFFFTGVTGTGKTVCVQNLLKSLEPLKEDGGLGLVPMSIGFSAQTLSMVVQLTIEGKLEKKRKTLLGAPAGRKVVIFVDDINMPIVEEYGAQPPVELLRQFLDFKGFYDRDKLFWKDLVDTLLFTGAAPPGGGRSEVTPRFTRHFNVMCIPPTSNDSMTVIFKAIVEGFLSQKFDAELKKLSKGLVAGAIEVYNRISTELLPTPAKFHYTFNLRDVSKVFQGILMIDSRKCKEPITLTRLWIHECQRVFYDRLINRDDQEWFENLMAELATRHLGHTETKEDMFEKGVIIFADFLKAGADVKYYEYAPDVNKLATILDDALEEYNIEHANKMSLVFFTDAIKHTTRMSRILRQPRGNAMLVGVGGSGKQSTTRMAAHLAKMECLGIEINRGYGVKEFREDFKTFMIRTGVEGLDTVFLFTDAQIVVETMLEDINNVLNSGEIPNLFPQDEADKICGDMIPVCDALGIPASRDNCFATFVKRVWDKLHIVLGMSPVGDSLRIRCRNFPALINCCTIDWYMGWPESALIAVAERFLAGLVLPEDREEIRPALVTLCGSVHVSIDEAGERFFAEQRRKTYTTPKSYLDLINLYTSMLAGLQGAVDKKADEMEIGVIKLNETNAIVDSLQAELEKLKPVLAVKGAETEALLKQVAIDQAEADVVKEKVSAEEAEVKEQADEVLAIQQDAQKDLDVAMPALNSAVKALDSLTKNDLGEVKAYKSPPGPVKTCMEAVNIMLDEKTDWDTAKKVLGGDLLGTLKNYDKDNIKEAHIKKIAKYVTLEEMNPENMKKISSAATGLAMWVGAMYLYHGVAKEVGPKKAKLEEMNTLLNAANAKLAEKQAMLKEVLDKVAMLQQQCDETVAEKNRLVAESEQTALRLVNAEKLTVGLSAEGVRWKETLVTLGKQRMDLIGDAILACACISYYGPFTGLYRNELVARWTDFCKDQGIPCSDDPTLAKTLGDPVRIREWQGFKLPSDDLSTNNGILVTTAKRWPLMIDPQMQANIWIRKMEEKNGLRVTTMADINLLRVVEDCRESLEPAIEPVLQRAVFKEGNRTLIRLGDSNVDYDELFKLYMTTKMPNPHYLPETCIKVTIINFTVTMDGLTDQLLGDVVVMERPEVEEKNAKLIMQMSADKKKLG